MFKNLFKPKPVDFIAPMSGRLLTIEQVPDEVFSSKSVGDGFAIELAGNSVCSPVDGKVVAVFPTKHAIGIKALDRNEYLIHVGLDTMHFKGEGFTCFVEQEQDVKKGQKLLDVDVEFFKSKGVNLISPIIVTNCNGRKIRLLKDTEVQQKEEGILAITI